MAFSERVIPLLLEMGIQWVEVADNHISRCCENYAFSPAGDNCDPPNPADIVNPPQPNWFRQSISRGCTPNNAFPYSMQPHYAQYVSTALGCPSVCALSLSHLQLIGLVQMDRSKLR